MEPGLKSPLYVYRLLAQECSSVMIASSLGCEMIQSPASLCSGLGDEEEPVEDNTLHTHTVHTYTRTHIMQAWALSNQHIVKAQKPAQSISFFRQTHTHNTHNSLIPE